MRYLTLLLVIGIPVSVEIFVIAAMDDEFGSNQGVGVDYLKEGLHFYIIILDVLILLWSLLYSRRSGKVKFTLFVNTISTIVMVWFFAILFQSKGIYVRYDPNTIYILSHQFVDCLYFSAVTWTSLGYGDVAPSEDTWKYVMTEVLSLIHI